MRHKILTTILAFILISIIISSANSGNKEANTTSPGKSQGSITQQTTSIPATIIDAAELVGAYDQNKLAAQDKYTGKVIQTKMFIDNITNGAFGGTNYYLSLNPTGEQYYTGTSLSCYFNDKSQLVSLSKGQEVTVKGTMEDMSVGIIDMKDCELVK